VRDLTAPTQARGDQGKGIAVAALDAGGEVQPVAAENEGFFQDRFDLGEFNDTRDFLKWDDWVIWTAIQDDPFIQRLKHRDMLKMVHEIIVPKRLDDASIKKLEMEIAVAAGVNQDAVFIDAPYFPTVPYAHATTFDPEDIPVCDFDGNDVSIKKLSDLSAVFSLLKGYWGGIRVYTWKEHRDRVASVVPGILGRM
nr:hypothetical protein [Candidatus Sigynarchaeota archaeon]